MTVEQFFASSSSSLAAAHDNNSSSSGRRWGSPSPSEGGAEAHHDASVLGVTTPLTASALHGSPPDGARHHKLLGGPGVVLRSEEGKGIIVSSVAVDAAAMDESSEISPGDTVESVDGRRVVGWKLRDVIDLILGEPGTLVTIGIMRPSTERGFVTMTRLHYSPQGTLTPDGRRRSPSPLPDDAPHRIGSFGLVESSPPRSSSRASPHPPARSSSIRPPRPPKSPPPPSLSTDTSTASSRLCTEEQEEEKHLDAMHAEERGSNGGSPEKRRVEGMGGSLGARARQVRREGEERRMMMMPQIAKDETVDRGVGGRGGGGGGDWQQQSARGWGKEQRDEDDDDGRMSSVVSLASNPQRAQVAIEDLLAEVASLNKALAERDDDVEALECDVDELLAEYEALGAASSDKSKRDSFVSDAAGGDVAEGEALALKNRQLEGELRSAYLRLEDADARVEAAQRREQEATKRLADSDKSVIALEEEISALQSAARSATSPTRLDATQSPRGGIEFSPSPSPSADRAAILRLEDMVEMLLGIGEAEAQGRFESLQGDNSLLKEVMGLLQDAEAGIQKEREAWEAERSEWDRERCAWEAERARLQKQRRNDADSDKASSGKMAVKQSLMSPRKASSPRATSTSPKAQKQQALTSSSPPPQSSPLTRSPGQPLPSRMQTIGELLDPLAKRCITLPLRPSGMHGQAPLRPLDGNTAVKAKSDAVKKGAPAVNKAWACLGADLWESDADSQEPVTDRPVISDGTYTRPVRGSSSQLLSPAPRPRLKSLSPQKGRKLSQLETPQSTIWELSKNNKGTDDDEAELEASSLLFAIDAAHKEHKSIANTVARQVMSPSPKLQLLSPAHKEQQASLGGVAREQHVRTERDGEDGFSDATSSPGRKMMGTPGGGSRGAFNAENTLPTTFEEEIGTPGSGGTARPMTPGDNKLMGDEPPMTPGGGLGRASRPMTPGDGMDGSLNMSLCSALEKKGVWDC